MTEFRIDRIRFTWKGEWTGQTRYIKDDIVKYQGKAYTCLISHNSAENFNLDLTKVNNATVPPTPLPYWEVMFDGYEFRGDWLTSTYYNLGDIIVYNGVVYVCNTAHRSNATAATGLEIDQSKWTLYFEGMSWQSFWQISTRYRVNDVVKYYGKLYKCNTGHTSTSDISVGLEVDLAKWDLLSETYDWLDVWNKNVRFGPGAVVRTNGVVYRCNTGHTSQELINDDIAKWDVIIDDVGYVGDWIGDGEQLVGYDSTIIQKPGGEHFFVGDLVKYGANLYKCIEEHVTGQYFEDSKFELYAPGYEYEIDAFDSSTPYQPGDIVKHGGYNYVSNTYNLASTPALSGNPDWSFLDGSYRLREEWDATVAYLTGDFVRRSGHTYVCIQDNVGQETEETAYWTRVIPGEKHTGEWLTETRYAIGDVVTYLASSYVCLQYHDSDGTNRPNLDDSSNIYWVLYVEGTITNVLQYQGDLKTFESGNTIRKSIGEQGLLLRIKDTNGTLSNEWQTFDRSDRVFYVGKHGSDEETSGLDANTPFLSIGYAVQHIFDQGYDDWVLLGSNISNFVDAIVNSVATPFAYNTVTELQSNNPATGFAWVDLNESGTITADDVTLLTTYYNNGTTGDNDVDTRIENLEQHLKDNYYRFAQEYILLNGVPTYVFQKPLNTTIIVMTGIYEEALPIRVPAGCAIVGDELRSTVVKPLPGNELADMFYVRNGSGIRNLTMIGLSGELTGATPTSTGRPTAGAYVSLDPGTGINDTEVWISTRSCYVQNCSTFGTGCVGLKIDGALHAGGNRSIVANDFTQILSDGIGVWCTRNALTELVSVFSYYGHIGYLAEDGGKIRATNGNSSYGTYGVSAEGFDGGEVPISATVNNRTTQATTGVLTGQTDDGIFALRFTHAGQDYTYATPAVTGAGESVDIEFNEFRNDAISDIRIITPGDSSEGGGSGYLININNAQAGDTTTITIATNDTLTINDYLDMKIFIVSGTGAGQYAYIDSLDEVTKVMGVKKEDGTPGWEHMIPGTAPQAILDTTTRYQIEPAVSVSAPTYNTVNELLDTSRSITDIAYGDGTLVAVSDSLSSPFDTTIVYSDNNGENWTTIGSALPNTTDGPSPGQRSVGFIKQDDSSNGAFIAIPSQFSDASNIAYYWSNDRARTWEVRYIANGVGSSGNTSPSPIKTYQGRLGFISNNQSGGDAFHYTDDGGYTWNNVLLGVSPSLDLLAVGKGIWITAYTFSGNTYARYSDDNGASWNSLNNLFVGLSPVGLEYGNNRFVMVLSDGSTRWSEDAVNWTVGGSVGTTTITDMTYSQGLFAIIENSTDNIYFSQDSVYWENKTLASSSDWATIGANHDENRFVIASGLNANSFNVNLVDYGATAKIRPVIAAGRIGSFEIYDPGSGYVLEPDLAITDPNNTVNVRYNVNVNRGVLTQPDFHNRGINYRNSTTSVTISGDGFADRYQLGNRLIVENVSRLPGPGDNLNIDGIEERLYKIIVVDELDNIEWTYNVNAVAAEDLLSVWNGAYGPGKWQYDFYTEIVDGFARGDIDNSGAILPQDSLLLQTYIASGTTGDTTQDTWIESKIIQPVLGDRDKFREWIEGVPSSNNRFNLRISPTLDREESPAHGTSCTIRQKYSQVRLTNHDFLDIGTGNFEQTQYPDLYVEGVDIGYEPQPQNEAVQQGGGRVFYTSTDQDGNFRVGDLFKVEQSTGIVTISADFFDLQGLDELKLGGVAVGGSEVVIREFSTDVTFTADSNNIVPTQKAVKQYLTRSISGGGANASTNVAVAGVTKIGGPNILTSTLDNPVVNITAKVNNKYLGGIDGTLLAMNFFANGFMGKR